MPLIRVSPKTAPDQVFIDPDKIHSLIGPIKETIISSPGPAGTKVAWQLKLMMDAGVTHTVRFDTVEEVKERMERILKQHNASFTED